MMDLVDNFDDIDTDTFTVVPWDLNLAFGATNGDGGAARGGAVRGGAVGQPGVEFARPGDQGAADADADRAEAIGGGGGNPGGSNVLAERCKSTASFTALYQTALTELQAELFDSGLAADLLAQRVAVLEAADTSIDSTVAATEAASLSAALV